MIFSRVCAIFVCIISPHPCMLELQSGIYLSTHQRHRNISDRAEVLVVHLACSLLFRPKETSRVTTANIANTCTAISASLRLYLAIKIANTVAIAATYFAVYVQAIIALCITIYLHVGICECACIFTNAYIYSYTYIYWNFFQIILFFAYLVL